MPLYLSGFLHNLLLKLLALLPCILLLHTTTERKVESKRECHEEKVKHGCANREEALLPPAPPSIPPISQSISHTNGRPALSRPDHSSQPPAGPHHSHQPASLSGHELAHRQADCHSLLRLLPGLLLPALPKILPPVPLQNVTALNALARCPCRCE